MVRRLPSCGNRALTRTPRDPTLDGSGQPLNDPVVTSVRDNTDRSRFELEEDGKLAFAEYRLEGKVMTIPHVEADPALRGSGSAGRLMTGVMEITRGRSLKILPICGYAAAWMRRHPQHHDLLAE